VEQVSGYGQGSREPNTPNSHSVTTYICKIKIKNQPYANNPMEDLDSATFFEKTQKTDSVTS
jgi:hypothetical protein